MDFVVGPPVQHRAGHAGRLKKIEKRFVRLSGCALTGDAASHKRARALLRTHGTDRLNEADEPPSSATSRTSGVRSARLAKAARSNAATEAASTGWEPTPRMIVSLEVARSNSAIEFVTPRITASAIRPELPTCAWASSSVPST